MNGWRENQGGMLKSAVKRVRAPLPSLTTRVSCLNCENQILRAQNGSQLGKLPDTELLQNQMSSYTSTHAKDGTWYMVGDLNPGIVCMEAHTVQSKQSTDVELYDARPSGM